MVEPALGAAAPDHSLLQRVVGASPLPPSPEEHDSPELDKVGDLVTRGTYTEAGKAAEQLLRAGTRDVRLIGPWLFGAFLAQGPASLHTLFSALHELLTQRWGAFGPRARKEVQADNGLRWLFKAICKHLEHHEQLQDTIWQGWREPRHREPLQQSLTLSEPLLAALASTLPKGHSIPPFRQLVAWLRTFTQALPEDPSAPPGEPEALTPAEAIPAEPQTDAREAGADTAEEEPSAPPLQESRPMVPASPALELLMRKLHAFGALIQEKDFLKASVVASDVLSIVERFDPRLYLPALFTPFFTHLSTHAQELEPLMQDTESLSFRALHQLYQVDLDAFQAPTPSRGSQRGR